MTGSDPRAHTGAVPLVGPRFHTDPQRLYAEMRLEHGPVVPVELPGGIPAWLVIGYRELHQVVTDTEMFPRDVSLWNQWPAIPADWPLLPMVGRHFTSPEQSRRHIAAVEPALAAVDAFALRNSCEALADRLIDGFCGLGRADLVAEFAEPIPALALALTLGFPPEAGDELARSMKAMADGGADAQAAHVGFAEHFGALLGRARAHPGEDLASGLLRRPGSFTDDEEYVLVLMAIMLAGHLTTADWLSNTVRLMLTDDRFAAALGAGRHSVGQAMNEVLWDDTPSQILCGRWASRDTRLADRQIRAGDMLMLGLAAANADPHIRQHVDGTVGGDPVYSGNQAHCSFGYGLHRCPDPAQQIAEIIARTSIEVLLDRLPDLDLAVPAAALTRRPSPFLRGTTALPVRFTPVPAIGAAR
ncbi:cytochrome P450 [Nocardia asteroides]|uniref:cytochrome P450 n=1 Tax=Nocardia asteroides TaxID=1824 RepID=UPI001E6551EA|nr:cytochrome P450 [Nocardia asteroides]UGT62143.1 cytochrome P450 [Nocardia asteroides]